MSKLYGLDFNTYDIVESTGYGKIAQQLTKTLDNKINIIDKAGTVLNFCMPAHYKFKEFYNIGYTPWESTKFPRGWIKNMRRVDDMWTTSSWMADLMRQRLNRDIFVVPHGIEWEWTPLRRYWDGKEPFIFIHSGGTAIRKGADILFRIWYKHFRKNPNVHLIFRATTPIAPRILDKDGSIIASPGDIENITVVPGVLTQPEIWKYYALSHAMVYPSRGEGFGLIPFEAMATGLPTILPNKAIGDFYSYGIELSDLTWIKSDDQKIHPGDWLDFNEDELINCMESVVEHYHDHTQIAYKNAYKIHEEYHWDDIAWSIINRIESKI